jgi:hypothetical protein
MVIIWEKRTQYTVNNLIVNTSLSLGLASLEETTGKRPAAANFSR